MRTRDAVAAAEALRLARDDIFALDAGSESAPGLRPGDRNSPPYVSPVLPAPSGPFLIFDTGFMPRAALKSVPDMVAVRLEEADVADAEVGTLVGRGPLIAGGLVLDVLPRAIGLRVFTPTVPRVGPAIEIPDQWVTECCSWLAANSESDQPLLAMFAGVQFEIPADSIIPYLAACREGKVGPGTIVSGDLADRVMVVGGNFDSSAPNMGMSVGGPGATDADLLKHFDALRSLAQRLAPDVGYAFINIEPTFGAFSNHRHGSMWGVLNGIDPDWFPFVSDQLVLDAFPYQIVGAGHMERLRPVATGSRPLPGGRYEISIGDPRSWLLERDAPVRQDTGIEDEARELLYPCLAFEREGTS